MAKNSFRTFGGLFVPTATLTREDLIEIAERIGYDPETQQLRGNRITQPSTDKIVTIIRESIVNGKIDYANPATLYRRTVATIRINGKSWDCCDGGNTFRALYHVVVELGLIDSIDCMLLFSDEFSFKGYNQIDAPRKADQVLDMAFQDGWGEFRKQLFTLSCLRSVGASVVGGGVSGRTWKDKVYLSSDEQVSLFSDGGDSWFITLVNSYVDAQGETSKQSFHKIVETISTQFKYFKTDSDGPLAYTALLDVLMDDSGYTVDKIEQLIEIHFPVVLDKVSEYVSKPGFIPKLQSIWKPGQGLPTYNRQGRYCWLCSFFQVALKGLDLSKVTPKTVAKQGIQQAFTNS